MTAMTLADIKQMLPNLYSESSLPVYTSAFDRVERLTGRRLSQIPADVGAWEDIAKQIVWAGEFKARSKSSGERAFKNFKSKISGAIKSGTQGRVPVARNYEEAWDAFVASVALAQKTTGHDGKRLLPSGAEITISHLRARLRHVQPCNIDFDEALTALENIPSDKAAAFRSSLRTLNTWIGRREELPGVKCHLPSRQIPPLPGRRDAPFKWSLCEEEWLSELTAMVDAAVHSRRARQDHFGGQLGQDPLANHRPVGGKRRKPSRNPEGLRKGHWRALSWLARHGFESRDEVYALHSVDEFLTESVIKVAVRRFAERGENETGLMSASKSSSIATYLGSLGALARRNNFCEDVIYAIEDAPFLVHAGGVPLHFAEERMSAEREKFVKLLDRDRAKVKAIVSGPRTIFAEAKRQFDVWDKLGLHARSHCLHLLMASTAMALQLSRPLRTRNVNEIRHSGEDAELLAPVRCGELATLDIPFWQTKNAQAIEGPIPAWAWHIVDFWIREGRARWLEHYGAGNQGTVRYDAKDNDFLFPGAARSGAVCRGTFNKAWNKGVQDVLGLRGLTPHVMRHAGATIYLARYPGRYSEVADPLGDKERTTRAFYARGAGREAAALFAGVLVELDPSLNEFIIGGY